jgi:hypothetical protein
LRIAWAFGAPLVSATSLMRFRKGASTHQTAKSALLQNQSDLMISQGDIPFFAPTNIMDFPHGMRNEIQASE